VKKKSFSCFSFILLYRNVKIHEKKLNKIGKIFEDDSNTITRNSTCFFFKKTNRIFSFFADSSQSANDTK